MSKIGLHLPTDMRKNDALSNLLRVVEGIEPGIGLILLDVGAQGGLPREWKEITNYVR